jgi:hypothetical protein
MKMGIMELGYCADGTPVMRIASGRENVRFRQKQEKALDYFTDVCRTQGYITREDAEYGARVRSRPMQQYRREKKSIIEKVISFFVEEIGE